MTVKLMVNTILVGFDCYKTILNGAVSLNINYTKNSLFSLEYLDHLKENHFLNISNYTYISIHLSTF